MSTPVAIVAGMDPVLRDAVVGGLMADEPRLAVLRHEVSSGEQGTELRRLVVDSFGVVEDGRDRLEGRCVTCAVREDAVRTLARLRDVGRWTAMVYCPPLTATTLPFCTLFEAESRPSGRLAQVRLATVAAVVDLDAVEHDVFGDDLLAERGVALSEDDRRSVGEVVSALLGHADLVVADGAGGRASALVDHLRAHDGQRVDGVGELVASELLAARHRCAVAARRLNPRFVRSAGRRERDSVWTLDLHSDRPFHPRRLLSNIEQIGGRRARSRGRFWLPDRPASVCSWDGAGAQLSIGDVGAWDGCARSTRLVFIGTGDDRPALVSAFENSLVTPDEMRLGPAFWAGSSEVLAPWL